MSERTDLIYAYDGSFEGLLCCVFASYEHKEIPWKIVGPQSELGLFDSPKWIETDAQKAARVYQAIAQKISPAAQRLVKQAFLTCALDKEMLILKFLRLGFKVGSRVLDMLTDETVDALFKTVRHLTAESHKYMGFVRFSAHNNALVAVIEPKNFVLPLLAAHFCDRFRNENFLIYDKTHKAALIYQDREAEIVQVEDLELPPADEQEEEYRRLWQGFYKAIAIESRYNPCCRMTFMPKRYWSQLTEMQGSINKEF